MIRRSLLTFATLLAFVSGSAALAETPKAATPKADTPKIDPEADAQLRKMSDYVSGLKGFKFQANIVDEAVTKDGLRLQFLAEQAVAVRRPDRLRTDRLGPIANTVFRYDGKTFSIYGKETGYYATAAAPPRLEAAVSDLRTRYGVEAPAADLFIAKPHDALMDGVTHAAYLGVEPIDGAQCHHLAFRGAEVDFQLWVQDGPKPLPCRYTITSKQDPGQPEFTVAMSKWQTDVALPDSLFSFQPPPGATRIELQPLHASR